MKLEELMAEMAKGPPAASERETKRREDESHLALAGLLLTIGGFPKEPELRQRAMENVIIRLISSALDSTMRIADLKTKLEERPRWRYSA